MGDGDISDGGGGWTARALPVLIVVADLALAALVTALSVSLVREIAPQFGAPLGVAVANAAVHGTSVSLRRVAPVAVVLVLGATALVHIGLGLPVVFLGPPALVGLYGVAARRPRRVSLPALAGALAVLGVGIIAVDAGQTWDSVALYVVLLAGSWALGDVVRRRQEEAAVHADRAAQLEQARTELARRAVAEERLRIARELHDVVTHSLTAVSVHAGTARLALDADPVAARAALVTIERTTRGALAELRQLVGVLRADDGSGAAPRTPSPRLDRLAELAAASLDAGLPVDVSLEGDIARLPPGLQLTAYRIVQEALTNTRRHAGATRAHVVVRAEGATLLVRVADDGRGGDPDGSDVAAGTAGVGLAGMRERVALYGGELRCGPSTTGGFVVEARLPVPPAGP